MFDITPLAREKLTAFLVEKNLGLQVRIAWPSGAHGGEERLILVPDKPGPDDLRAEFGPLTLCLSRELYKQVGRLQVDFRVEGHDYGFVVESARPPAGMSGCAGCTACG